MPGFVRNFILLVALSVVARGHVVSQLYGEWRTGGRWEIEVLFDAGYAVPEWRGDADTPPPGREWLVNLGESGWATLRTEAERYFRECLEVGAPGHPVGWEVDFPDFEKLPPDFPVLLNGGAYFRMLIRGDAPLAPGDTVSWKSGERPVLVVKLPGEGGGYLTLEPGAVVAAPSAGESGRPAWIECFVQGFLHVVPHGWDHVLFVLGLFFYRREWRPLVAQSLAFTAAHTVTLGLAAAGMVRISGNWVEPAIAISLVAVALENLRPRRAGNGWPRLAIVFGFGLIHGLGFAGVLSAWIRPGEGFLVSLLSANIGVEVAQAALLAAAWCLTLGWHSTTAFGIFRTGACLAIAVTGGFWAVQRLTVF